MDFYIPPVPTETDRSELSLRTVDRESISLLEKIDPNLGLFAEKYCSMINVKSDKEIQMIETERKANIDEYIASSVKCYNELSKALEDGFRKNGATPGKLEYRGFYRNHSIRPSVRAWGDSNPGAFSAVLAIEKRLKAKGWSLRLSVSEYSYDSDDRDYSGGNVLIIMFEF